MPLIYLHRPLQLLQLGTENTGRNKTELDDRVSRTSSEVTHLSYKKLENEIRSSEGIAAGVKNKADIMRLNQGLRIRAAFSRTIRREGGSRKLEELSSYLDRENALVR